MASDVQLHDASHETGSALSPGTFPLFDIVRLVISMLLLTAAALKGHELATEPVVGRSVFSSRWFLIALVELELVFGLWLLVGKWPRETRWCAIGLFGLFAVFSLFKIAAGAESCGCFGKVSVNPWFTFLLDLGIIVALLKSRVTEGHRRTRVKFSLIEFAICAVLFVVPTTLLMGTFSSATLAAEGAILGNGQVVVLEPATWVGQRFPLTRHIDLNAELHRGKWTVVLHRHDCSKCDKLIGEYVRTKDETAKRIAFIEVPPFGNPDIRLVRAGFQLGRLSDERRWFVSTPVVLNITNGRVVTCDERIRKSQSIRRWRQTILPRH